MSGEAPRARSLTAVSTLAVVAGGLVLLLGVVAVWTGFASLLDARSRVFDRLEPSLIDSERLTAALLDQETGIRGYALARDERMLDPYRDGRDAEQQLVVALRSRFVDQAGGAALADQLATVEAGAAAWREEFAEPVLAGEVPDGDLDAAILRSKASFDEVRADLDEFQDAVVVAHDEARADLEEATTRLVATVVVAIGLLAALGAGGAWFLRRRVVRPLAELVESTDAVAAGQLEEPIRVDGPAEIEHLANQVSSMRDRIVAELAAVEAARAELDERAAELARSNDDLEQFAYVASHDLQEPLRKVASFCQLIEQRYGDQLDERGRSYIEFAVDGAKRMQALISDLLDFSRVGRTADRFVPCDLRALALEAIDAARSSAPDATFEVGDLPIVAGDPSLYGALLQNLVGNAIKYRSPDRPLAVVLDAEPRPGDDGEPGSWAISFADNGIGIEPRFRERVFVIFQRLHGRDAFEGTGIGLALCKKIVEFSGGQIWIDEPPDGVGTQVRFTLPATTDHPARPKERASA
ncbi:MAG: ATP-binding protein [Acidimicrobiales bacterium]